MPAITVNGVRLYYDEAGAGPPLLLIHAFPVGRRMWEPQMAALAARHRVIAYDVRGFGLSDAPKDPAKYSQAISVEDARALLGALGAAPAAVCGLSMGGNIALNLALSHPEAVSKLIACDTGAGSEDPAGFRARCEEYVAAAEQGVERFFDAVMEWPVFADYGRRGEQEREREQRAIDAVAQPGRDAAQRNPGELHQSPSSFSGSSLDGGLSSAAGSLPSR